jgi:low affinity Fe/Cu permease
VVLWLATGPLFAYSDAWQLVMNTWTNVVTFLMVFVIQNSRAASNALAKGASGAVRLAVALRG